MSSVDEPKRVGSVKLEATDEALTEREKIKRQGLTRRKRSIYFATRPERGALTKEGFESPAKDKQIGSTNSFDHPAVTRS
jgi:hypothetical protein